MRTPLKNLRIYATQVLNKCSLSTLPWQLCRSKWLDFTTCWLLKSKVVLSESRCPPYLPPTNGDNGTPFPLSLTLLLSVAQEYVRLFLVSGGWTQMVLLQKSISSFLILPHDVTVCSSTLDVDLPFKNNYDTDASYATVRLLCGGIKCFLYCKNKNVERNIHQEN